jgi:hypothetical protein
MGELILIGFGETKKIDLSETTIEQVIKDLTTKRED